MSAKEMFEELGYEIDKEPRFGSTISYTQYCSDGCCRIYDLVFYVCLYVACIHIQHNLEN